MFERLYFHEGTLLYSCKKIYLTTVKKKVKWITQTKKDFITCSKLIFNKLGCCPTRPDNVYLCNNEQASLAVIAVVFCFEHDEHNSIKLKLRNN